MTIQDACSDSSFFLQSASDQNPVPTVKKNHNYYNKLQGLMATCNVKLTDLMHSLQRRRYF